MGLLDASQSSGGSQNSAYNTSQSYSDSWANNAGAAASEQSEQAARIAFERQKELLNMQMNFNREEAQKARDWEENMANTIYTRSTKNMKEAGINPILAANMGLSGASVGSGATASIGGATAPMANTFSEYNSASHSSSYGIGESQGSSWNQSTSGFTTALEQIAGMFANIGNALSSGINVNFNATGESLKDQLEDATGLDFGNNPNGTENEGPPASSRKTGPMSTVTQALESAIDSTMSYAASRVHQYQHSMEYNSGSGKYGNGNGS